MEDRVFFGLFPSYERLMSPDFKFVAGELPLSSFTQAFITCAVYVLSVFALKAYMKNREPVKADWLRKFSIAHNVFLFVLSAAMLTLVSFEIGLIWYKHGRDVLLCDQNSINATGRVAWWYYIFYLSKFYELLDTVILVLKKRPLIFLHWYHHFITLLLVWVCMANYVAPMWGPVVANCTVHIFMYYYYSRMARGTEADKKFGQKYKQWITRSQIWQFIFDEIVILWHFKRMLEEDWKCSGGLASVMGISVLSSFLVLFMMFYTASYGKAFGGRLFQKLGFGSSSNSTANVKSKPVTASPKAKKVE